MSLTGVFRHYRKQISGVEQEPWKIAHEKALKVLMFEEAFGNLVNVVGVLVSVGDEAYSEAIKRGPGDKAFKQFDSTMAPLTRLLGAALTASRMMKSRAKALSYFDYEHKYEPSHFDALIQRLEWSLNPDSHVAGKLRPKEEVEREFREGKCGPLFEA